MMEIIQSFLVIWLSAVDWFTQHYVIGNIIIQEINDTLLLGW